MVYKINSNCFYKSASKVYALFRHKSRVVDLANSLIFPIFNYSISQLFDTFVPNLVTLDYRILPWRNESIHIGSKKVKDFILKNIQII